MKCSRCTAELPDSATYCYQCGQSITNRVEPAAYQSVPSQYQSASFSYLPAGTPPWPTAAPTLARPTAAGVSAGQFAESPTTTKPKRSVGGIFAMVGLLLLIPLLGAAVTFGTLYARGQVGGDTNTTSANAVKPVQTTPQATPEATTTGQQLPTPTSNKQFSDTDLNVALLYPENWDPGQVQKSTTSTSVQLRPHEDLNINFGLAHYNESATSGIKSPDDLNQAAITYLSGLDGVTGLQIDQSQPAETTIGGAKWAQKSATFQANAEKYHMSTFSVQHNKAYYSITVLVPDKYYVEAMSKYIQPMLQSIQFIK